MKIETSFLEANILVQTDWMTIKDITGRNNRIVIEST